jgi:ubiquinone/menaquinone biosynthesis C-methylase UbiE
MRWESINRAFFDAISGEYDQWLDGAHGKLTDQMARLASVSAGEMVLDIGCGTGLLTCRLAAGAGLQGRVVAIDISAGMLARARAVAEEYPNASFYQASASPPLWFRADTFDLICISDSLSYLDAPQVVLDEARRMLRPRGRLGWLFPAVP